MRPASFLTLVALVLLAACSAARTDRASSAPGYDPAGLERATFGAGCFWCSEAAFEQLDGVVEVVSGFMGGDEPESARPDGSELVAHGHAEVVQVLYDPGRADYDELLDWFWRVHDPTSLNRQGEDEGPEYRSVIFAHTPAQLAAAQSSRERAGGGFERPIVTTIEEAGRFFPASEKHQDYYARNRAGSYCRTVIAPHLRAVGLEE